MNGQTSPEQVASVYNKVRPGVQHLRRNLPFGHLQNCCYVLQAFGPLQSRNGGLLEVTICQTSNPPCSCRLSPARNLESKHPGFLHDFEAVILLPSGIHSL